MDRCAPPGGAFCVARQFRRGARGDWAVVGGHTHAPTFEKGKIRREGGGETSARALVPLAAHALVPAPEPRPPPSPRCRCIGKPTRCLRYIHMYVPARPPGFAQLRQGACAGRQPGPPTWPVHGAAPCQGPRPAATIADPSSQASARPPPGLSALRARTVQLVRLIVTRPSPPRMPGHDAPDERGPCRLARSGDEGGRVAGGGRLQPAAAAAATSSHRRLSRTALRPPLDGTRRRRRRRRRPATGEAAEAGEVPRPRGSHCKGARAEPRPGTAPWPARDPQAVPARHPIALRSRARCSRALSKLSSRAMPRPPTSPPPPSNPATVGCRVLKSSRPELACAPWQAGKEGGERGRGRKGSYPLFP